MQDPGRERLSGLSLTQETELELSNLDMRESAPLDDTLEKGGGDRGGSLKPLSALAEPEPPSFELSLDDLAMEESHGDTEASPKGQDSGILGLDMDMDETPGPTPVAKELKLDDEGPGTAAHELSLDMDTPEAIAEELGLAVDAKADKLSTLTMDFGHSAKSGPAPKGSAGDDPMPELEAALLEMEKEL